MNEPSERNLPGLSTTARVITSSLALTVLTAAAATLATQMVYRHSTVTPNLAIFTIIDVCSPMDCNDDFPPEQHVDSIEIAVPSTIDINNYDSFVNRDQGPVDAAVRIIRLGLPTQTLITDEDVTLAEVEGFLKAHGADVILDRLSDVRDSEWSKKNGQRGWTSSNVAAIITSEINSIKSLRTNGSRTIRMGLPHHERYRGSGFGLYGSGPGMLSLFTGEGTARTVKPGVLFIVGVGIALIWATSIVLVIRRLTAQEK